MYRTVLLHNSSRGGLLIAIGMVALAVGCNKNRATTYPTQGAVSFSDGIPVRFGVVNLVPTTSGTAARGRIESDGSFQLGTFARSDGVVAGEYRVVIVQHTAGELVDAPAGHEHSEVGRVPLAYTQFETTPLRAQIDATAANRLDLTIERAVEKAP